MTRRWGGSYEALESFARESQTGTEANSRLALLMGFAAWDRGRDQFWYGQFDASEASFREALSHGPLARFWSDLGFLRDRAGDSRAAVEDLDRALALSPQDDAIHYRRAHVLLRVPDYESAIADLRFALALDPANGQYRRVLRGAQDELELHSGFGAQELSRLARGLPLRIAALGSLCIGALLTLWGFVHWRRPPTQTPRPGAPVA